MRELLVFNKIDLIARGPGAPQDGAARIVAGADGVAAQAWVSAATGDRARRAARRPRARRPPNQMRRTLHLDLHAAAMRSDLYRRNAVRAERQCDDGSWEIDVELDSAEIDQVPRASRASDSWKCRRRSRKQRVA